MATIRFLGVASSIAQVDTLTVGGTIEIGDVFIISITGGDGSSHTITYTAVDTVIATVVAGLVAAWNASTNALCAAVTAADASPDITLTADTAGVAFSVTASTTESGGGAADTQTFVRAATTVNSGSKDWSVADNWSSGAVPGGAASQDVVIEGAEILYGLDQSGIANTLNSLTVINSQIGVNPAAGCIPEYLQIKASNAYIGRSSGPGTLSEDTPVNIDFGSTACNIIVYNTGTNSTSSKPAVRVLANSASSTLVVNKGIVGIAIIDGETATISSIGVNYTSNKSTDSDVFIGEGVTLTTLNIYGGETECSCGVTTINHYDGEITTLGSGAITTVNCYEGDFIANSTGTITTFNNIGGDLDLTKSPKARTITTLKMDPPATVKFNPNIVTLTNQIQPYSSSNVVKFKAEAA